MWLFDNLFLDKNTPMKINIGEENSPVWSPLLIPDTENSHSQEDIQVPTSSDTSDAKKTNTVSLSTQGLPEIAHFPQNQDTSTDPSTPLIDIGGDIPFDIGGDIPTNPINHEDSFIGASMLDHPVDLSVGSEIKNPSVFLENSVVIENSALIDESKKSEWDSPYKNENHPASSGIVDDALFSLLNNSKDDEIVWDDPSNINQDTIQKEKNISTFPLISSIDHAHENISPDMGTKKIKNILNQSITELHKIEVEDAFKKAELMKKILDYDTHILQIEEKSEDEISELKVDRDELVLQMKKLSHEVRGIKSMVQSFQKELDTV